MTGNQILLAGICRRLGYRFQEGRPLPPDQFGREFQLAPEDWLTVRVATHPTSMDCFHVHRVRRAGDVLIGIRQAEEALVLSASHDRAGTRVDFVWPIPPTATAGSLPPELQIMNAAYPDSPLHIDTVAAGSPWTRLEPGGQLPGAALARIAPQEGTFYLYLMDKEIPGGAGATGLITRLFGRRASMSSLRIKPPVVPEKMASGGWNVLSGLEKMLDFGVKVSPTEGWAATEWIPFFPSARQVLVNPAARAGMLLLAGGALVAHLTNFSST